MHGLVHLRGLTCLHELFLDHTKVTDAGLTHLEALTYLQYVSFLDTSVTYAGRRASRYTAEAAYRIDTVLNYDLSCF